MIEDIPWFHVDDGGYGRTTDIISELVACAYGLALVEYCKTKWRALWFALVFRFGKSAIIIIGIELVALAVYLVGLLV